MGPGCAGEDDFEVSGAESLADHFAEDLAEVGGEGQIAAFVELVVVEAGPAAIDLAAFHVAAENKHRVGVTVVSAAGAVFAGGAAELRHGDQGDVFGIVAQVAPEGGDGGGEVAEAVGKLAVDAALVLMRVPSADVGECGLDAEVGLEQLGDLPQAVAEFGVGDNRRRARACIARGWRRAASLRLQMSLRRLCERFGRRCRHTWLQTRRQRAKRRLAAASDGEAVEVVERDGGDFSGKGAGDFGAEGEGAEGGVLLATAQVFGLQGAVEPAVLGAFDAGSAGLHVVLRVEVGARHVGRSGGVDDGEMALIVERLEGRERGMEAEESVEVEHLVLRNGDAGAHGVVVLFAIGDDDVETVGGAALKDDDQAAVGNGRSLGHDGADEEAGDGRGAGEGKGAVEKEESAG